jgi:hypothetical protein
MIMPAKRRLLIVALVIFCVALIGIFLIRTTFTKAGKEIVVSQYVKGGLRHRSMRSSAAATPGASASTGVIPTEPDDSVVRNPDPLLGKIIAMRSRLGLTNEQIAPIADCLNKLSEDRLTYERQIATATRVNDSEVLIQIPAYPQQGAVFLQAFEDALTKEIGTDHASELKRLLAQDINVANDYLGSKAQEIRVTKRDKGWLGFDHKIYSQDDPNRFVTVQNDHQVADLGKYNLLRSFFLDINP